MSKRKPYMHSHFMSMMRITPSADAEGRHSEGKKPYSRGKITYKQMEDLYFKDISGSGGGKDPCSGHKSLTGGFVPLSINCDDGAQTVGFEISSDFVSPVMVADSDGLSFTNDKPLEKNVANEATSNNMLLNFDPEGFSGNGIDIICVDVIDATCGGSSTFCMFIVGCSECSGADCALPTLTGPTTTVRSSTAQYALNNPQGDVSWSVSGTGATIDQTGLMSTDGTACGTVTVTATDSCCGDFTTGVRVTGTHSDWVFVSDTNYSSTVVIAGGCNAVTGGICIEITDGLEIKYWYTRRCCCGPTCAAENEGLPSCATPGVIDCSANLCVDGCATLDYVSRIFINSWECK